MSKKAKINQLKTIFDQFKGQPFDTFFADPGTYTEWEGIDLEEFKEAVEYIIKTYEEAFEKEVFHHLPFNSLNALVSSLTNANQHCPALFQQKQQGQFQNAAQQVDSVVHQLMVYDVNYYLVVGKDVEEIRQVYETESQKLTANNAEVEGLKKSVKGLIEPAISGSLSKSFSDRRASLFKGRIAWGFSAIIFAIVAVYATYNVSDAVISSIQSNNITTHQDIPPTKTANNTKEANTAYNGIQNGDSWSLILLRSVVLVPLYLGFGFAFSQYRKERDLEEEYAHKAAVATTLPNYGDLAKDDSVKDQIVSGASNVIFTSPVQRAVRKEKDTNSIESIKSLFETASKAFKRGE